jgi:hypothetical protein
MKLYECNNKNCELGTEGHTAYFTEGMTSGMKSARTGIPLENLEENKDYGEGICPVCGKPGKPASHEFEPLVGNDRWDERHQEADKKARMKIEAVTKDYQNGDITDDEFRTALAEISAEAQESVAP